MRREASIPLFLWAATAILGHLMWGGGAEKGAQLIDDRLDVGRFAAGIRNHVQSSLAPPIEIAVEGDAPEDELKPEDKPPDVADDSSSDDATDEPTPEVKEPPRPKPKQPPKPEEKKAEPEPPKPEEKKPTPEKLEIAKPLDTAQPKPPPELELPKKIAVQQHVDDEHQKDNPSAKYISDKNNHVEEETRARVTSTDQDAKQPTPGSAPSGPKEDPGNAQETHVRQDSDQPGLRAVAPGGEHDLKAERATAAAPATKSGDPKPAAAAPGPRGASEARPAPKLSESQERNQSAKLATPERAGTPEVVAGADGSFSMNRPEAATPQQRAQKAKKRLPPRRVSLLDSLGYGAAGLSPGGVALNLTPSLATAAVGADEMSRLRRADGERRRSEHRGSWTTPSFERYRSAIENYVPAVKPGNQTALNTAAAPFALYLHQIHNRIHPIFADEFLDSLDHLPASHPLNDQSLVTKLELVVDREEGRLLRRGVVHTSGVTAFDVSAISAVDRAAPFGPPPSEIVSPDGNVYLHWEFRRDQMACSTLYAYPYILNVQPKPAPLPTPLPPFRGPDEAPQPGERHGLLLPLEKAKPKG